MNMLWIIALSLALLAIIVVATLGRTVRRQQLCIKGMEGRIEYLVSNLNALCASAVGVDDRVLHLERLGRDLEHRQESLETQSQPDRPYGEAIQMVHQGATPARLVETLDLSRSEAELLVALHGLH
jgi:hypothetical protein